MRYYDLVRQSPIRDAHDLVFYDDERQRVQTVGFESREQALANLALTKLKHPELAPLNGELTT